MAALTWTWKDWWEWYRQIEKDEDRTIAMKELLGGTWLQNLSEHSQADVMIHAPLEILRVMKDFPHIFKREAILIIQNELFPPTKRRARR